MKNEQFDENNRPVGSETEETPKTEPEMVAAQAQEPDLSAADEMPAEKLVEEIQNNKPRKKKTPNRRLRYGGMAVAVTALVAVGVVLLNVLVGALYDRFPLSLDLTSDDRFSLSQETEDVIAAVNRPVEIVAFFSEETARNPNTGVTEIDTIIRQLYETWNQYELRSDGLVTVEYIDLISQRGALTEYTKYGDVQEWSVLFRSGEGDEERYRLKNINEFYTYEQDYYGNVTSITSLAEVTTASGVNAVSNEEDLQVMLLTGHNEDENVISRLTDLYELNGYTVNQINLASSQEIGEAVTTAIVAAPASDFSDAEITRLRDWLTNDGKLGRNLMVVVNSLATSKDCPNLYEFLDDGYQIEVTDNLVVEIDDNRNLMGYNGQLIYGDLPESPVSSAAAEGGVLSGNPRQILLKAGTDTEQTLYNIPLVTFPESSLIVPLGGTTDDPEQADDPTQADDPEQADDPTQEGIQADEYPIVGMGMAVNWTYDNSGEESVLVQTNVVVCNQGMVVDTFATTIAGNQTLSLIDANSGNETVMMDIMNYINGNEDSVTISGKSLAADTSLDLSESAANVLGVILAIVLPVGLLIICLVVFLRRRHL